MRRHYLIGLAVIAPATAYAWPAETDWVGVDGVADEPSEASVSPDYLDLIGDSADPVLQWSADATTVAFRVRVSDSPTTLGVLKTGNWTILVDVDGVDDDFEFALGVTGPTSVLEAYENVDGDDGPAPPITTYNGGYGGILATSTGVRGEGTGPWYVEWEIDIADFNDALGLSGSDLFRVAAVTGSATTATSRTDIAGCDLDAGACATIPWSDAFGIDPDGDTLSWAQEERLGSDPLDDDSDDDGLWDGSEPTDDVDGDGVIGILDCDSDGDGLVDGLESHPVLPNDTAADGCAASDTDGTTTTDPNDADSDDGGVPDGVEDRDQDGQIDAWETDPNDGTDDVDTDGDGIADSLEGGFDADSDGFDNEVDTDSDGDGLTDADEGVNDTDEDGLVDFLDPDSDGDGIPDVEEGSGDTDGDGKPDYLDDDSDGDGKPDVDEGTKDSDCDGIPDWLDPDDDDFTCDTDVPDVDTDGPDGETDAGGIFAAEGDFTGGSCSSTPGAAALIPTLLAAAALRRRKWRWMLGFGLVVPTLAHGQEIDAQRFRTSVDGYRYLKLEDTDFSAPGTYGAGLWVDHAFRPFVFRFDSGEQLPILADVTTAHLSGFYRLGVVRLGAEVPLHLQSRAYVQDPADQSAEEILSPDNVLGQPVRLGDVRLSAKVPLYRLPTFPLGFALWVDGVLPTGSSKGWLGSGKFSMQAGGSVGADLGPVHTVAQLGLATGTGVRFGGLSLNPSLLWGLGATYSPIDPLLLSVEIEGGRYLGNVGQPGKAPAEGLISGKYRVADRWLVGVGVGTGLSRGVGAPDLRVLAGVSWHPGLESHEAPKPVAVVTVIDDADRDGISDDKDVCRDQPEDMNGRFDDDGCPDGSEFIPTILTIVDPTGAKIAGARVEVTGVDAGRYIASDGVIGHSFHAGEQQLDVTADGFVGTKTTLGLVLGQDLVRKDIVLVPDVGVGHVVIRSMSPSGTPVRGVEVKIGDRSWKTGADGVYEADLAAGRVEATVSAPGWKPVNRVLGLSAKGTVDVTVVLFPTEVTIDPESRQIFLDERVFFDFDTAVLRPESTVVLDKLAAALKGHPEVSKIRIEGHTDTQGPEPYNLKLSNLRSRAVVDYLVKHGISRSRLESKGFGEATPIVPDVDESAHAVNRRVEVHITAYKAPK